MSVKCIMVSSVGMCQGFRDIEIDKLGVYGVNGRKRTVSMNMTPKLISEAFLARFGRHFSALSEVYAICTSDNQCCQQVIESIALW
jgi:hypothetical protein